MLERGCDGGLDDHGVVVGVAAALRRERSEQAVREIQLGGGELDAVGADVFAEGEQPTGHERSLHLGKEVLERLDVVDGPPSDDDVVVVRRKGGGVQIGDGVGDRVDAPGRGALALGGDEARGDVVDVDLLGLAGERDVHVR